MLNYLSCHYILRQYDKTLLIQHHLNLQFINFGSYLKLFYLSFFKAYYDNLNLT